LHGGRHGGQLAGWAGRSSGSGGFVALGIEEREGFGCLVWCSAGSTRGRQKKRWWRGGVDSVAPATPPLNFEVLYPYLGLSR
jgi:hypothetical protein